MKLRPEEITSILKERIEQFDVETDLAEVGTVLQVGDGIARIHGLENCLALEMLELEHGVVGLAFNLEEDNVGAALFGEWDQVKEGEILVCRMTNPAWVVLFTKIVGLVTDAGGVTSHPAVVSHEFGIPAVVGTSNATERIKTGDRIRVNGSTGVVEVLS